MDFAPPMPPSSILILKSVAGELPASSRDTARAARALRSRIASLAARAARPARGDVADADAVWFRDESELMACLLEDVIRGRESARWYWLSLAARFGRPLSVARALAQAPQSLPAVIAALDARRVTTAVILRLSRHEAAELTMAMLEAHAQLEIAAAVRLALRPAAVANQGPPSENPHHAESATDGHSLAGPLHGEHALLVRLARTLATGTSGSGATFLREAKRAIEETVTRPVRSGRPQIAPLQTVPVSSNTTRSEDGTTSGLPVDAQRLNRSRTQPQRRNRVTPEHSPQTTGAATTTTRGARASGPQPTPGAAGVHADKPIEQRNAAEVQALPDAGWPTRYGGAFYLIGAIDDVAPAVECEAFRLKGRPIGRWMALELVIRRVLTSARAFDAEDGIWSALAELDGRPPAHRLPARLSPRLKGYIDSAATSLAGWVGNRLGVDCQDQRDLVDACVLTRALVSVSPMHLDVSATLDQIRLTVRRAGLDVDPGWLPAWKRIVRFHFLDRSAAGAS